MHVRRQYYAALCLNLLSISVGGSYAWASLNFQFLQSDKSPITTGKLSLAEASLFMSLLSIGGLFGNLFFGFVTERYGRKYPLIFSAIPLFLGWVLVIQPANVWYLYTGNVLTGFVTGGLYILIPLYVSEIANDSNRGALGSLMGLSVAFGMVLGFLVGACLSYAMQPVLFLILIALFSVVFVRFPESPSFLEKMKMYKKYKNLQQAEASSKYFHGTYDIQRKYCFLESAAGDIPTKDKLSLSDFATRPAKRALCLAFFIAFLSQFCGVFVIFKYCTFILEAVNSFIMPDKSFIVLGINTMIGTYLVLCLIDKCGRKFLFISALFCNGTAILLLGSYYYLQMNTMPWFPLMMLSVLSTSLGCLTTLPSVIYTEIFPEKIRDYSCALCSVLMFIFDFVLMLTYPVVLKAVGFHYTMWCLAAINFIGAISIKFYLPETKGKSKREIAKLLEK